MRHSKVFFCLALISLMLLGAMGSPIFVLTSEESPPFNYTDEKTGKFIGLGTELIEEIFRRTGMKYNISPLPWLRAYNGALNDDFTCVFMASQTPERLPLFKWVGPFLTVEWVVYGTTSSHFKISTLEDLKKIRLGGYSGDAPVMYLQKRGYEIDLVSEDALNPKKLQLGRIDGWITNSTRGPILAKKAGVTEIKKVFSIRVITHYMACNKQIPDTTIELLNRKLQEIKAEGLYDRIIKKYEKEKVEL